MTLLRCNGQLLEQPSETANVSSTGVLFKTRIEIGIGTPVEYTLQLVPAMGPRQQVQLHCLGKVVRHAETDAVAVTIERYEFLRP